MVIKIWQWKDGSKENKEAWIKKELREVINFEESIRKLVKELSEKNPRSEDYKVYSEILEFIQRMKKS